MIRNIAIAVLAATMLGAIPAAIAQEVPELEGAPGYRSAQQDAAARAEAQKKAAQQAAQKQAQTTADKLKADQAKIAQQAAAQKTEQARLAKQAEDLRLQQARLDARAAELAAEEKRLTQLRADQQSEATRLAELTRQRERDAALRSERDTQTAALPPQEIIPPLNAPPLRNEPAIDENDRRPETSPRRPALARLDFGAARRSCVRAAEEEALDRDFYSARYDGSPSFYPNEGWEIRGRMRLEDRRGYLIVDSVCEVDSNSEVRHFAFLR